MAQQKRPVIVKGLRSIVVGRPDASEPMRVFGTFENVTGPGISPGREATVVLDLTELGRLDSAAEAHRAPGAGPEDIDTVMLDKLAWACNLAGAGQDVLDQIGAAAQAIRRWQGLI